MPDSFIDDGLPDCISLLEETFKNDFANETLRILPGVKNLLGALKERAHLGVVTGNCRNIGYAKLRKAELADYIKVGAFGSEHDVRSELVKLAQQRATVQGFAYTTAVVIGDTPRDVLAAREGGAKSIAVATGKYSVDELAASGADIVVATLEDTDHLVHLIANRINF